MASLHKPTLLPNKYPGLCTTCAKTTQAGAGFVVMPGSTVFCREHQGNAVTRHTKLVEEWETEQSGSAVPPAKVEEWYKGVKITEAEEPSMDAKPPVTMTDEQIEDMIQRVAKVSGEHFLKTVPSMVESAVPGALAKLAPREVHIKVDRAPVTRFDHAHKMLDTILKALCAGASPMLVGPAGSGKTTLAQQCAKALKLKFYMAARVTSEFRLIGFIDATGKCVRTQFREAYERGGVFLFDEVDAGDPDAMTTFNAALANGVADFPDGMVTKHKDFYAIAAGNTYGRGADRQYVGRSQLDAATLDRFQVFDVDYDEHLERTLAGNDAWVKEVQKVRAAVLALNVRHVVSPRASIVGAKLLAANLSHDEVMHATVWKGLPAPEINRIKIKMESGE